VHNGRYVPVSFSLDSVWQSSSDPGVVHPMSAVPADWQGKAAPADHSLPLGQAVRQPPLSRLGQGVKRPNERVESGCPVDHLSNWLQSQHAW
jgi:hypothetical protein